MASNPFATQPGAPATGASSPFATNAPNGVANAVDPNAANADLSHEQAPPEPPIDLELLTSETLTAAEGDAFAEPPPPPDAIYRVKLRLRGITQKDYKGRDIKPFTAGGETAQWVPEAQKDKNGITVGHFAKCLVDVQIHDPKFPEFEGIFLQVPYMWLDTKTPPRGGPSKVNTLLNLLKQPSGKPWIVTGQKYSDKQMIELFVKALAGEPELKCQSQWSVTCDMCQQEGKKSGTYPKATEGMQRFPQVPGKPGVYSPEMPCLVNRAHGYTKARAQAVQFFAVS